MSFYLKFVFLTSQTCSLFLPEVVGLDDVGPVNGGGEVLLKDLEDGLNERPGRTSHIDDNGEAEFSDIVAERENEKNIERNNHEISILTTLMLVSIRCLIMRYNESRLLKSLVNVISHLM